MMAQQGNQTLIEWLNKKPNETPTDDVPEGNGPFVSTEQWLFLREGADCGFWTGKSSTGYVGGWGRARSHVIVSPDDTIRFGDDTPDPLQFILTLPATGMKGLVYDFGLEAQRITLLGTGPLADFAALILARHCEVHRDPESATENSIIVDAGNGLDELAEYGHKVARGARYIKIVEPDAAPFRIDVYPNIHKRSLDFSAAPLFRPDVNVTSLKLANLDSLANDIVSQISDGSSSRWISYSRVRRED